MRTHWILALAIVCAVVLVGSGCGSKTKVAHVECVNMWSENGQPAVYGGNITIKFDDGEEGCAKCDEALTKQFKSFQKVEVVPDPAEKDAEKKGCWVVVRLAE